MGKNLYHVKLTEFEHRGHSCFELEFEFNTLLKELIKSIKEISWSTGRKTFYVPKNKLTLHQLYTQLNKRGIYVDYSHLKNSIKTKKKASTKRIPRTISDEKKELIRSFVCYLRGLRLSENTIRVYFTFVADFVEFIGDKSLDEINNTDIRLFVEQQVVYKKYAISTHRQLVSAIKHFGRFLPDTKLEVEELPRPSSSRYLPTVLSKEEVVDLLRATKNLKHRTILAMLYSAGLRISEVINLELKDIDVDRRQLHIKNAKGRKDRVVVLAESFIPLYKNYYMTYRPRNYFIEGPNYRKYTAGSIRNFLKQSCKRANIGKHVTPHTLRHSYATHLIENGVGLRYVQDLLGHSKPETTMIYTHVAKKDLLQIQSPLDTVFIALSETDKKQQNQLLSDNISR